MSHNKNTKIDDSQFTFIHIMGEIVNEMHELG